MPQTYNHLSRTAVGRLALDRYDFKEHVDGTDFNQEARTVALSSGLVIDGYTATNVRSALEKLILAIGSGGSGGFGGPWIFNSSTGTINNLNSQVDDAYAGAVLFIGGANPTLTGLSHGSDGRRIVLSVPYGLIIPNVSSSSTNINRIETGIFGSGEDGTLTVEGGAYVELIWRPAAGEEGYGHWHVMAVETATVTDSGIDPWIVNNSVGTINNLSSQVDDAYAGGILFIGAGATTLTGLAGGTDGRRIVLSAPYGLTIPNTSGSSTDINRIETGVFGNAEDGTLIVSAGSYVELMWRPVAGEEVFGQWRVISVANSFKTKRLAISQASTSTTTLTLAQQAHFIIDVSGSPGGNFIVVGPDLSDTMYYIKNRTPNTLTFKKSGGTGVAILTNTSAWVFHDGSDYVS